MNILKEIIDKNYNKNKNYHFDLFTYNGPPHNEVKIIKSNTYEVIEQKLLLFYLKSDDNVLELGANIGTSSILISKILNNPKLQHIAVEPNIDIIETLEKNKKYNNVDFNILNGIISPIGNYYLNGDGWGAHIVNYKTKKKVNTYDFYDYNKRFKFNVLFADCEGSLFKLIKDYPDLYKNLRLVIYEKDGKNNEDYSIIDNYFINNNFKKVFEFKQHIVFQKN